MNQSHLDNIIIEIGQNTQLSPGDLMGLAITKNPVKKHQHEKLAKGKIVIIIIIIIIFVKADPLGIV